MKITLITSPNVRCGIAEYTSNLYFYLKKYGNIDKLEYPFIAKKKFFIPLLEKVNKGGYNLVHIQHAPGLFGGDRSGVFNLMFFLKNLKTKYVITLHEYGRGERLYEGCFRVDAVLRNIKNYIYNLVLSKFINIKFINSIKSSLAIIVHSECLSRELVTAGIPSNKITVIPHGIPDSNIKTINIPLKKKEKKNIITFGFIKRFKNYEAVIKILPKLEANIIYIVAGSVQDKYDEIYLNELKELINNMNLKNRVIFTGFLPNSDVIEVIESASLMIFPYRNSVASGAMASAIGLKKPILAPDLEINREVNNRNKGTIELYSNEEEMFSKIQFILDSQAKRKELEEATNEYAVKYSYEKMALQTYELYKKLLK